MCEEGYEGGYSSFTYQARKIEEELGINQKEGFIKLVPLKGKQQIPKVDKQSELSKHKNDRSI